MRRNPSGRIRQHHSQMSLLFRLFDGACISGSLWLVFALYDLSRVDVYSVMAAYATLLFYIAAEVSGLYRSWRGAQQVEEARMICTSWFYVVCGVLVIGYASKTSAIYSRRALFTWFAITPIVIYSWHFVVRFFLGEMRRRGLNSRTVIIAGAGDLGSRVGRVITNSPWLGLRLVGYYDDFKPVGYQPHVDCPGQVCGDLDAMIEAACQKGIDFVYIALPLRAQARVQDLVVRLSDSTASVYVVPDLFVFDLMQARLISLDGLYVVSVFESPFLGFNGWLKRAEDIVLATLCLIISAIPMLLIALGVKLTSCGPVIFRQHRYGVRGQEIEVWKFRTMTVCEDGCTTPQARRKDPRITPFGAFLRRTSLDELPQFFNVLWGHMSIVGPRPHSVAHNEHYRKLIHGYMLRHKVKPGITGWAQISGWRGETDTLEKMERRIECDLWYIRNWSLWLDLKIFALSTVRGFWDENAY